jgi:3-phosphoshikimate 1-carboxyvinyltransferase
MSFENSLLEIKNRPISGEIVIPGSKSYANRMLVLAAQNPRAVLIQNLPESTDVLKMIEGLKKVGLQFKQRGHDVEVINSFPECECKGESPIIVNCGDGGTTTRFLSALVAKGKRVYHIEPSGGMRNRPVEEMVNSLRELGVKVDSTKSTWLSIQGPIQTQKGIEVDCSRSTQFASALALALKENTSLLKIKEMKNSKMYFQMTLELIKKSEETLYKVPIDYSSASYPLALAAVTGAVVVKNCHDKDPYQADSFFLDVLTNAGAIIEFKEDGLTVLENGNLTPFDVSCSACPDLAPTLAYLASFCDGISRIRDLEVLAHKESHRLHEIKKLLDAFKVDYESDGESFLEINGKPAANYTKAHVVLKESDLPEDHRIVMTAYLFMRTLGGGELGQTHQVRKSFSNFFEVMGEAF